LLTVLNPIIINGRLIIIRRIEKWISVIDANIRDIPVTPPSRNELGSKNPFKPKPAATTPSSIKKEFWMKVFKLVLLILFNLDFILVT
jgi:hypothetical protein